MLTHRQRLADSLTTRTAILRGERRRNPLDSTASVFSLTRQDVEKVSPTCITDTFGQFGIPDHVLDLQVFDRDDIKLFVKLPGWFKVETPVGEYNPDWAIVKQDSSTVYLVRETRNMDNASAVSSTCQTAGAAL